MLLDLLPLFQEAPAPTPTPSTGYLTSLPPFRGEVHKGNRLRHRTVLELHKHHFAAALANGQATLLVDTQPRAAGLGSGHSEVLEVRKQSTGRRRGSPRLDDEVVLTFLARRGT